ncbi:MAG TPA: cytochrome c3 family protein [Acetobacteraceae bacterium]|nr:cytochrome c3 family protein [Acetobacteraceae bacterium]
MAAVFRPGANLASKLGLVAMAAMVLAGIGWWWGYPRTDYRRNDFWYVGQTVPFSHRHHVGGLGIDCRFCHIEIANSEKGSMPPTHVCMTCHSQIWTNAKMLAPVRDSLASNTPLVWNRVTNLPDYVFFNHSIHIAKGVGCSECHGPIDRMDLTYKAKDMEMTFCIDCHVNPGPRLRPADQIYNTEWQRTPDTPSPKALLAEYHIPSRDLIDCSVCHR